MKKILFASTALIATAGVASAEITLGGSARFGLAYNEANTNETRVEQRMRVNITGIAETDSGVKFETRFRLESNEDADSKISGRGPGSAGLAVSYEGLRVDVGNVSDVIDSGDQVNFYGYGIGLTALIEHNSVWYDANPSIGGFGSALETSSRDTAVKARYTMGDFSFSVSYTEDQTTGDAETHVGLGYQLANGMSIGAAWGTDDSIVAAGVNAGEEVGDYWVATLSGAAGQFGYSVIVGDADDFDIAGGASGDLAYGASVNYEISSATSIQAAVSGGGRDASETAYGLGFQHSLGGGVTLAGGVARDTGENTLADLGVKFSF
jgi:outer membrane protein OmpU